MIRFGGVALLCLALVACGSDGAGPNQPPPPPPPPGPTISDVVPNTPGPWQLIVEDSVLFWVDTSSTPFKRLSLTAGATPTALFQPVPAPEGEISDGNYIYWVNGANLYRTTLDGTSTALLDHGTGSVGELRAGPTMDATNVYWVNSVPSPCSPSCTFGIRRVPKAGGAAAQIATTTNNVFAVTAIAIAGGYVYWEEESFGSVDSSGSAGSKINKVAVTGGAVTTVVDGRLNGLIPPPSSGFTPASWFPRGGIVADTDFVYFADADFFQRYRVLAVPVGGGSVNILLADTTHTATDFVRSMTSDSATLYWVDQNDLRSLPKAGGSVTDLAAARTVEPRSVTRVGANLYWIEAPCCAHRNWGKVYTIPTTPGGGTPVAVHDSIDSPFSIASDAAHLFWIEGGAIGGIEGFGSLRASALNGANKMTLAESASSGRFAADASWIYFANRFTIKRVSRAGGKPQRLGTGDFFVTDVATDGVNVYWLEDGPFSVVHAMPVNGGPIATLGTGPGPAGRMRIDGTYVYWLAHEDEIDRVPKAGGTAGRIVGPITGSATDFAIDATNIFISGWDSRIIYKTPIAGGTLTPLVTGLSPDQTRRIAANGGKVYWIDQQDVGSMTANGSTQVPIYHDIITDPFGPNVLAFDSQSVYWTEILWDAIRKATPK